MYKSEFIDIVNLAFNKTEHHNIESNKIPNPYYIGFGNPNSKVLILGKEKGFGTNNLEALKCESIDNPKQWKKYTDNSIALNNERYYDINSINIDKNFINPFFPYENIINRKHTWFHYKTLLNRLFSIQSNEINLNTDFLNYSFISEINHIPSKASVISQYNNDERINFLKSDFFKSFNIIILACNKYLKNEQIEDIFDVKFQSDNSKKNHPLKIFKKDERILLNTRQLSNSFENQYLTTISDLAKPYI